MKLGFAIAWTAEAVVATGMGMEAAGVICMMEV